MALNEILTRFARSPGGIMVYVLAILAAILLFIMAVPPSVRNSLLN